MTDKMKKTQIRTCIGCRSTDVKHVLIRLVNSKNGVMVDKTGKCNGRGAYIHNSGKCWDRILDGRVLRKALRVEDNPDNLLGLRKDIEKITTKMSFEVV
ncbi:MAG: hypothetical protein CL606_04340 [Anaerolineaceae bacterium]|nr:hypothetical protein [Anaerolineaceae bacterium]|tara:strand:+ start:103 stop:399 length:297 start_codon:yes stop_codon:yes gene_type:complete